MTVCKHSFQATIDTDATISVIDHATFKKMDGVNLKKTNIKTFAYNAKEPVKFQVKFEETIETKKKASPWQHFNVAQTSDSNNLISATTAQDLGLLSLHVNNLAETKDTSINKILAKH